MTTKSVDTPLKWLVGISLMCLLLVFGVRGYFNDQENELKARGANERARLFVGEEIVRGIQAIEKDIYRMAATQNAAGFSRIKEGVNVQLTKLQHDLSVLKNGGTSRRLIQLNIDGQDEVTKEASYQPALGHQTLVMELIEIEPLLGQIRDRADTLEQLLSHHWLSLHEEDRQAFFRTEESIALLLKQIPPYFERLNENANRLFVEGDQRLRALEAELENQTLKLKRLETGLISLVIVLGGVSAILFMRRLAGALFEAQQAKDDIELQREQNATILDTLNDGVYATDLNGHFTFINAAGERILGWTASELTGQSSHQMIHHLHLDGTDFPQETCPLITVLQRGASLDGEDHFIHRNGRFIPVSYRSKPLMQDGRVTGSLVSFHDISERIESEALIRLQRAALDAAANMILISDRSGLIEYVNRAFCQTTGYTEDEVLGQSTRILNSGLQDNAFYQSLWAVLLSGHAWEGELSNRRKNGEVYPEQMTITPILNDGQITHFIAIKRDISEEVRTRTRLRLVETAIQEIDQGIYIMDALVHDEGPIIQYVNAGFSHITGYSAQEAVGTHAGFLYTRTDAYKLGLMQQAMRQGTNITLEMNYQRKDGSLFVGELHLSPVHGDSGCVSHYIGLLSDIGLRKQAEAALRDARDQALENSRLKSEFLSTMSHEIRTPMNGIIGMTDLLLDTKLDEEQREFTGIVRDSAQTLLVIINDILDFSKIEAGKLEVEITDFSAALVVESTVELLLSKAREKSLNLSSFVDPALPTQMLGDPTRLRQVLVNLIGNAIKFTESGEITVRVTRSTTETAPTIRFEVTDTGIGIPSHTQTKLFQSFTQADSSTTRKYGGTGLGLAICKRLIELMGGHIGVNSEPGKGSTFWFTLPLESSSTARQMDLLSPHHTEPTTETASISIPRQGTRHLILLAEDNQINQKVAELQINKLGYALQIVANGQQAVDAVLAAAAGNAPNFSAILMDCQMPVMDGFEATAAIRKALGTDAKRIPIIAMTANAMQGDRELCLAAGMDDYLSKPIDPEQLRNLLEKWTTPATTDSPPTAMETEVLPKSAGPHSIINFDLLHDYFGDEPQIIKGMLELFQTTTSDLLVKLRSAIDTRDSNAICALAHEIKGSSSNIGIQSLALIASQLETTAAIQGWDTTTALLQELEDASHKLNDAIAQLNQHGVAPQK
ncbi:PAS domain S-box protein [Rhodoferax sp.]|uniref:PAS domain S-box protein n=1 Tax=Rhodoferax sp. TaxID=50421 RepID=UPI002634B114|nr:PAS domain S-box protein [Rhodoferax sp.]MDD2925116.1 PAS domain S-box protein [Rhodoferax sp.]